MSIKSGEREQKVEGLFQQSLRSKKVVPAIAILAASALGGWWWHDGQQPITQEQRDHLRVLVAGVSCKSKVPYQGIWPKVHRVLGVRSADDIPRRDWPQAVQAILSHQ